MSGVETAVRVIVFSFVVKSLLSIKCLVWGEGCHLLCAACHGHGLFIAAQHDVHGLQSQQRLLCERSEPFTEKRYLFVSASTILVVFEEGLRALCRVSTSSI